MRRAPRALFAALVLALLAAPGCVLRLPGLPARLSECPGPIPSTLSLPSGDWLVRERVRVEGDGVDVGFDVVAEKRGERLAVVGFHALGAKAFSLVQRGDEVASESHLGRALAVPPRNLLRDLHAAGLGAPRGAEPVAVMRPECGYTATFARVSRETL